MSHAIRNYFADVPAEVLREFAAYHEANPDLYERLSDLALQLQRSGRQHYGVKGLWEVLRYHFAFGTTADVYRLNNNYTSLYARLLMQAEPELEGFFELRRFRRGANGEWHDG